MTVSLKTKKYRKTETKINSSKEIPEKSNKDSVTKVGRAVAISKQWKMRERWDIEDMERERERVREKNKEIDTEREIYQIRDTWKQC